jgi:predicted Zn-dependent protease
MALPGQNVLVTDELVMLLGDSPRLDAVLAHELGHVIGQHVLGALYERGGVALIIGTILNEPGLITRVLGAGSTKLLAAGNSRHAEQEADAFAHMLLLKVGLRPSDLGDALEVMEQAGGASDKRTAYFGTHPATTERIKAARSAR